MRHGVVFPQTEIGNDPAAIRDFVQAAEGLGYDHILVYDHVVGANPASRPGWDGLYDRADAFHAIFVLFGFLAAVTSRIELASGIIILPQRQTALVAKQAAEVDVLTGGRLRLGVAVGWNEVEFEALGAAFRDRGRRSEEQIKLMRALWTNELLSFEGRWHRITDAGLNPLPVQRPIPIWFGGQSEPVIRRTARLADGWMPEVEPDADGRASIARMRDYAREAGRDPDGIGIEGFTWLARSGPGEWMDRVAAWRDAGATHHCFDTMRADLASPAAHIDAIGRFKEALDRG